MNYLGSIWHGNVQLAVEHILIIQMLESLYVEWRNFFGN